MPSAGHLTGFLMSGNEFSTDSFSLGVSIDTPQEDATTFQASAAASVSMTPNCSIDQSGYFSGVGNTQIEYILQSTLDTPRTIAALFGTQITACPVYLLPDVNDDSMKISGGQKLITVAGKWSSGAKGMKRGLRVYQGVVNTAGPLPYIDIGSAGSNGGAAYLFSYGAAAANAQVNLQSSAATNFSTNDTEASFTFSGRGVYAVDMTGTVNRYLRPTVVSLGGAASLSLLLVACVNNVTM